MQDPTESVVSVVSLNDKAVDWKAMGTKDSALYDRHRDASLLKVKSDRKPTEFSVRRLSTTFFYRRIRGADPGTIDELCAKAGIAWVRTSNGELLKPSKPETMDGQIVCDDEFINMLGRKFGVRTVSEMAGLSVRLTQLPEDDLHPFGCPDGDEATG